MDITEKMKLCFNDELIENKILTENEKKVLASLMYSYMICKESKDNIIIRSMDALRKDIQISQNALYDAIRNLESLYHMIERTAGESRGKERSSIASQFKLNFEAILHPPKERMKFDFSKKTKSSETSINTVVTDIVTDIDTVADTIIDNNTITNEDTNPIIDKDIKTVSDIDKERVFDIDCNIEEKQVNDVVFENEIKKHEIIDSSLPTKEESIKEKSIGECEFNEMVDGFSKTKDLNSLIEYIQEAATFLNRYRYSKERREKHKIRVTNAIVKRCEELGIDTNVFQKYFN